MENITNLLQCSFKGKAGRKLWQERLGTSFSFSFLHTVILFLLNLRSPLGIDIFSENHTNLDCSPVLRHCCIIVLFYFGSGKALCIGKLCTAFIIGVCT